MARPKLRTRPGGTYFITTDTWQRRRLFQNPEAARILEETLVGYREKDFYLLHRYVIMPDHLHALLTPGRATSLKKAVQLLKGGSSHAIKQTLHIPFPVWRPGFTEHLIRDQADYDIHMRYIDQNPVKAGFVETPKDYRYGAASGRQQLDPWPVASGAEALAVLPGQTAGLKPRPSKTHFRNRMEGRDFSPAEREEKNRGLNP